MGYGLTGCLGRWLLGRFALSLAPALVTFAAFSGLATAHARGGINSGERWIAIDDSYLRRFPAVLRAAITTQARQCGAIAAVRPAFARYIHVGVGGREFITLHFDHLRCAERSRICGPEGCLHQVYAPAGTSYRLVFNDRVGEIELALIDGRVAIRAECAAARTGQCTQVRVWDGHQLATRH